MSGAIGLPPYFIFFPLGCSYITFNKFHAKIIFYMKSPHFIRIYPKVI